MSSPQPYFIPVAEQEAELEIKKSRFIASLCPVTDEAAAKAFIERQRARFPGANHHCWAFVTGRPDASTGVGSSDDGEPAGTAGRPMLAVLTGADVGQACVVVTRFFGGTKLGTGGLVRAYSQAVRAVLAETDLERCDPKACYRLSYDYSLTATVEALLNRFDVSLLNQEFTERVMLECALPVSQSTAFEAEAAESLHGQAVLKRLEAEAD
ncbi:YigZ family protein [Marinobacterium alkalitolerans]|uniref:YigZ family protein n=1 Tax=Marinobacterium alkalitolerans TaxID=1542925 RepID=UPI002E2D5EA4|nr:YigZ family protein [Marinobacterium alkalitolerans]